MSNALVPTLSSRLQYGNNEILLENFTACMQMEDLIQIHNNGLYMEPTMMPTQSQSLSLVQQGSQYGPSSNKDISKQLPTKSPSDEPPYDVAKGNVRKRPFDAFRHNIETIINLKAKCHETSTDDTSHKIPRNNNLHPPVRRNQKLSDKITTLQKLVSPFGKTDTASVLHEASLYIKLLQEQIWNLCQTLNSSYNKTIQVHHHKQMCYGERRVSLRSKGLCLAEISVAHKVITMHGGSDSS